MARWLVILGILLTLVLAACGETGGRKGEIRNDLLAIQAAINRADYGRLYDDFSATRCKDDIDLYTFIASFGPDPYEITNVGLLDQNIVIDGDTAYVIVTATFRFSDGRNETKTFPDAMVKEGDHWRDRDCFRAGLGGLQ